MPVAAISGVGRASPIYAPHETGTGFLSQTYTAPTEKYTVAALGKVSSSKLENIASQIPGNVRGPVVAYINAVASAEHNRHPGKFLDSETKQHITSLRDKIPFTYRSRLSSVVENEALRYQKKMVSQSVSQKATNSTPHNTANAKISYNAPIGQSMEQSIALAGAQNAQGIRPPIPNYGPTLEYNLLNHDLDVGAQARKGKDMDYDANAPNWLPTEAQIGEDAMAVAARGAERGEPEYADANVVGKDKMRKIIGKAAQKAFHQHQPIDQGQMKKRIKTGART